MYGKALEIGVLIWASCFLMLFTGCQQDLEVVARRYRSLSDNPYSDEHKPRLKMRLAEELISRGAFKKGMAVDEVENIIGTMPDENRTWAILEHEEHGQRITTRYYPIHAAGGLRFVFENGLLVSWGTYEDDK